MRPNTSHQLIIEDRRQQVALLRRHRRLSVRQIVRALADAQRVNPKTKRPWGLATIQADLDHLTEQARTAALRDISEHKAEVLDDYQELLRLAWVEKRYEDARRVLKDMRELLGTDAPKVIIFEQMQQRMMEAVENLEREFGDEPAVLDRALMALMGADNPSASSLN